MSYRLERTLHGLGLVRKSTGLDTADEFEQFTGLILMLAKYKPALAKMWVDGEISALQLLIANQDQDLKSLIPDHRVLVPLAEAFERTVAGRTGPTVTRYRVSMKKFLRMVNAEAKSVRDLEAVDYEVLAATWPGSPSDYMAFYRMLSHFLTLHFGGKRTGRMHPFRCQVMDMLPRKKERKRVPSISPAVFDLLVKRTPDYAQPIYRTLLITGLRKGEFLALRREHLRPATFEIEVPGTKTEASAAVLPVAPSCWHWIERAVPSPLAYGQIRKHWMRACLAEGLATKNPRYQGPTLHDIRHLTAQYMTNLGVPEPVISVYLRHSDVATTRRYTIQQVRSEAADAMAKVSA